MTDKNLESAITHIDAARAAIETTLGKTAPPPVRRRRVWWHRRDPGSAVIEIGAKFGVSWLPFLNSAQMVREDGNGGWEVREDNIRRVMAGDDRTPSHAALANEAGLLMLDWEGHNQTDEGFVEERKKQWHQISQVVRGHLNRRTLLAPFRLPDHKKGGGARMRYAEVLTYPNTGFNAVCFQAQVLDGAEIDEMKVDVDTVAKGWPVWVYIDAFDPKQRERVLSDKELVAKLDDLIRVWPSVTVAYRSEMKTDPNGAAVAHAIEVAVRYFRGK